jgi:hypothetical protein
MSPAQLLLWALLMILGLLPQNVASAAGIDPESAGRLRETIEILASYGDRSTGTAGNQAAAAYIKERFAQLGFETVGSHEFSVPVMNDQGSTLILPKRQATVAIRPFLANAVSPGEIPDTGLSGPLVYVGSGALHEFNGKAIEGAVVLMELDSSKNWLQAANLGARALIYVDRGNLPKMFFEEKLELSPIQFPRF